MIAEWLCRRKKPSSRSHMKARKRRNRRGLSLSIAIGLLIIAVTVMGVIVVWMGGATGQLTRFEKIEIQSTGCSLSEGNWTVTIKLKNTGTRETTLTQLFINEDEVDEYSQADVGYVFNDRWATNMTQMEVIQCGESICVLVFIDPDRAGSSLTSRTMISIMVHALSGTDYLKVMELR
jgi:hypothetical protein